MNSQRSLAHRKVVAIFVAVIYFNTQVVFAGVPGLLPMPSLGNSLKSLLSKSLIAFHAFPYSNVIDPRSNTDLPQQSQSTPENLGEREQKQLDILSQMEELQIFQPETFSNQHELHNTS